jgi:hypothetical protein
LQFIFFNRVGGGYHRAGGVHCPEFKIVEKLIRRRDGRINGSCFHGKAGLARRREQRQFVPTWRNEPGGTPSNRLCPENRLVGPASFGLAFSRQVTFFVCLCIFAVSLSAPIHAATNS